MPDTPDALSPVLCFDAGRPFQAPCSGRVVGACGCAPGQVLLDPVSVPCCGKSFDQACLAKHLQAHPRGASCPICRAALPAEVPPVRACEGSARGGVECQGVDWLRCVVHCRAVEDDCRATYGGSRYSAEGAGGASLGGQ